MKKRTRISLITSILLVAASLIQAQIMWQENGIPIRQGVNIEWSRAAAIMNDNSIIYTWSDTKNGDRGLFAQKVNSSGDLLWEEGGIAVNDASNRQEDGVVIETTDGGVILAWVDFRNNDDGDIYAQKLNTDGELQWNIDGVPLSLASNIQISLNIVSDGAGGAFVIWQDNRGSTGGTDIYGTHVLTDGTIATGWEADGNPVVAENAAQFKHTFWNDHEGNAVLAWMDNRDPDDYCIYIQKIEPDGTLSWGTGGVLFTHVGGDKNSVKICPDGNETGFILSWRDKNDDADGDIRAQRIDLNGNRLWGDDGKVIYSGDGLQLNPRVATVSGGGAFVVWEDGRDSVDDTDIYGQKLDLNGNLLWDTDGVIICDATLDQENPRLMNDSNGGCFVVWDDLRTEDHPHGDIYFQHLDTDGNPQFEANGKAVSTAQFAQSHPLIKVTSENKIFVSWGDIQTGSLGIKVSIYNLDGSLVSGAEDFTVYYGLSGDAFNYKLLANGENPILVWEDTRFSTVANRVYYQVLNPDGSFVLENNGEPFTAETGYNQESIDAVYNGEANTIVTLWQENRGQENKIFAQARNSTTGNSLWNNNGLRLSIGTTSQYDAKIDRIDNDYFAGWTQFNMDLMSPVIRVMGQKITDGTLQWGDEGKEIADLDGDDVLTDVVGKYYIWTNEEWPDNNIYVKLVDDDGNTATGWPDNGLLVCGATGNQSKAKGIMTSDGLLVVWTDERSGFRDIYAQLVSDDASVLWDSDGISVVNADNDQTSPEFVYDEDNNEIIIAWEDFRIADKDLFIQKLSPTQSSGGTGIWGTNGVEAVVKSGEQSSIGITKNDGNYLIAWADYFGGDYSDLYIQSIDEDGNTLLDDNGLLICDQIRNQEAPKITTNGTNSYIFWKDNRSSGKTDIFNIYAQKVDPTDLAIDENYELQITNYELKQNYPNPFNPVTKINYELRITNYELAEIVVYNAMGQSVWSSQLTTHSSQFTGSILFDGSKFNSGVYYYSLVVDGKKLTSKAMVLIK